MYKVKVGYYEYQAESEAAAKALIKASVAIIVFDQKPENIRASRKILGGIKPVPDECADALIKGKPLPQPLSFRVSVKVEEQPLVIESNSKLI